METPSLKTDRLGGPPAERGKVSAKKTGENCQYDWYRAAPSLIRRRNRSPGQMSNGFFDLLAPGVWQPARGAQVAGEFVGAVMRRILLDRTAFERGGKIA
jgi:hypothetical protein